MKIITTTAYQYSDIPNATTVLAVPWQILDDEGSVLFEATQAFDLNTSADDIKAFLSQTLQTHIADTARNAESSVRQASLDAASQTAVEISNLDITQ